MIKYLLLKKTLRMMDEYNSFYENDWTDRIDAELNCGIWVTFGIIYFIIVIIDLQMPFHTLYAGWLTSFIKFKYSWIHIWISNVESRQHFKFACTLSVWHLRHQPSLQGPQPPRPSAVRVCRSVASSSKIKSPDYDIIICLHFKLIIRGLSSRCRQHRGEYRISHDQHQ